MRSDVAYIELGQLTQLLWAPIIYGRLGLLFGIFAVALPTAVRAAMSGTVTGCEFTPYLPFVLLAAIMQGWWQAGAVALTSVAIMGGLFMGQSSEMLNMPCFLSGAGVFLASSAILIGSVVLGRRLFLAIQGSSTGERSNGVIFSLEKGEVWASWHGSAPPVRLGTQRKVSEMMDDFLKQGEVAKRLGKRVE